MDKNTIEQNYKTYKDNIIKQEESKKQREKYSIKKENFIRELIGFIFSIRDASHTMHLFTNNNATHKALNEFYDNLLVVGDAILEQCIGKFGRPQLNDDSQWTIQFKVASNPAAFLNRKKEEIVQFYDLDYIKDCPGIVNKFDDLYSLFDKTLYTLTLK